MRKLTLLSALMVCLLSLTISSMQAVAAAAPNGTIQGTVTDTAQAILPGATVTLDKGGVAVSTDSRGQFG